MVKYSLVMTPTPCIESFAFDKPKNNRPKRTTIHNSFPGGGDEHENRSTKAKTTAANMRRLKTSSALQSRKWQLIDIELMIPRRIMRPSIAPVNTYCFMQHREAVASRQMSLYHGCRSQLVELIVKSQRALIVTARTMHLHVAAERAYSLTFTTRTGHVTADHVTSEP